MPVTPHDMISMALDELKRTIKKEHSDFVCSPLEKCAYCQAEIKIKELYKTLNIKEL
jgi:hypothetical protein